MNSTLRKRRRNSRAVPDLRHSVASQAVARGVPLPTVARMLGHTQLVMTLRYAHVGDHEVEARDRGRARRGDRSGGHESALKTPLRNKHAPIRATSGALTLKRTNTQYLLSSPAGAQPSESRQTHTRQEFFSSLLAVQ